jgi:hypothetical protein
MRLVPLLPGFVGKNEKCSVPFGIVTSDDPTDNEIYIQVILRAPYERVGDIFGFSYDDDTLFTPNWSQVAPQDLTIDGVVYKARVFKISTENIPFKCFYLTMSFRKSDGLGVQHFRTDIIRLYRFELGDPDLIRIESDYPAYDCLLHGLETGEVDPILQHGNYYPFAGESYRNFHWFRGDISYSEDKTSWEYEGFFDEHTKTNFLSIYDVILGELSQSEAKELTNVLGGKSITVWRNNKKLSNEFKVQDASLSRDTKYCALYGTRVKLIGSKKTVYFGC